ncbi:MFS transporter [Aquiflexum sp.]|uniref:MFS transporter n=1 Tax=Aquiflexum sp. TaxID=1872584 RepID=UPI0035932FFB
MEVLEKEAPPVTTKSEIDATYKYWRTRILYTSFIGYAVYYVCRVNISMALPGMEADLGFNKIQLGLVVSALQITYALGKFLNGILSDRSNPKYFMAIGLFMSGIANLIFGVTTSLWILVLLWGLNGWFQSMGFPAGARSLSHWYSPKEYGKIWGIFGTSHQLGAAIIYISGGYLILSGWQNAFIAPSFLAILTSVFLFIRLTNIPEKIGLPPVEEYKGEKSRLIPEKLTGSKAVKNQLLARVIKNKFIWFTAMGNLFLYIVRYGIMTWAPTFVSATKGVTITESGWVLAAYEVIGILGILFSGYLSDRTFKARRGPIMAIFMFLLSFFVFLFLIVPYGSTWLILIIISVCGFLASGALMLVSVAAATFAGKELAASGAGFTGFWGYIGATLSGVGIGWAAETYGWEWAFALIIASCLLSAAFFALTWNAKPKIEI